MRENLSRAQTTNGSFFLPTGLKVYTALVTLLLGLLLFCPLQEIYTQTTMSNANGERERTFIMVKPDGVQRGLVGEIIRRFEKKGFKLVALKFKWADEALLQQHYADLSSKPFFNGLVKYMRSGPVCPMVWEGLNVVKTGRQMLGETNPADSLPGTIRGDYCIEIGRNICHGSDAVDSAKKEMNLWFTPEELVQWKANEEPWLYE
jgi:nucleoside-diphosphate kinase